MTISYKHNRILQIPSEVDEYAYRGHYEVQLNFSIKIIGYETDYMIQRLFLHKRINKDHFYLR